MRQLLWIPVGTCPAGFVFGLGVVDWDRVTYAVKATIGRPESGGGGTTEVALQRLAARRVQPKAGDGACDRLARNSELLGQGEISLTLQRHSKLLYLRAFERESFFRRQRLVSSKNWVAEARRSLRTRETGCREPVTRFTVY